MPSSIAIVGSIRSGGADASWPGPVIWIADTGILSRFFCLPTSLIETHTLEHGVDDNPTRQYNRVRLASKIRVATLALRACLTMQLPWTRPRFFLWIA